MNQLISTTKNLYLFLEDNNYSIKVLDEGYYVTISKIYYDTDLLKIINYSEDDNFQTYICTFELYQEYIKLIDEVYDLLKEYFKIQ